MYTVLLPLSMGSRRNRRDENRSPTAFSIQ